MTVIRSTDLVSVSTLVQKPYALRGLKNTVQVLFKIFTAGPLNSSQERPPVNLAIVLDRSGSMKSQDKLENCILAINGIISQLKPDDRIHFVTYHDTVETIFTNEKIQCEADIERLKQLISQTTSTGCTNLGEGLKQGIKLVAESLEHSETGQVFNNRVFLFSDGLVNRGMTTRPELFEISRKALQDLNISTTTLGIGSDFDQPLMKGLSEQGGGRFYYITDGNSVGYIVEKALEGLNETCVIKTKLMVRGRGCGVVTKIWNYTELSNGVLIGDLLVNSHRSILVEVEVSPNETTPDFETFISFKLQYIPLVAATSDQEQNKGLVQEVQGTVGLNFTDDETILSQETPVTELEVFHVLQLVAEEAEQALKLMERGEIRQAIEVRQKSMNRLKEIAEKDESGQAQVLIGQLESTIAEMKRKGDTKEVRMHTQHEGYTSGLAFMGYTYTAFN